MFILGNRGGLSMHTKYTASKIMLPVNRLLLYSIIFLFLTGCQRPVGDVTLSPTDTFPPTLESTLPVDEVSAIATYTPVRITSPTLNSTLMPSSTPTRFFTPTPTYFIPEGVMEHSEMEQRISDWITGAIEFTEDDRILDEVTGTPLRLGLFSRGPLYYMTFTYYNLGFVVVNDQKGTPYLIVIAGFEDPSGQRFTFPFHIGELVSDYAIIDVGKYEGRRIGIRIYSSKLKPIEVTEQVNILVNHVTLSDSATGDIELTRITEYDYPVKYHKMADATLRGLVSFLECETCSVQDSPENIVSFLNSVPDFFERAIPYLRNFRVVYW